MNVNSSAPMSVAKRELSTSIDSLSEDNQFQIVFYNEAPIPLSSVRGVSNRMHFAKEADKKRAKQFVRSMMLMVGRSIYPHCEWDYHLVRMSYSS